MINKHNERIQILFTEKQAKWLEEMAKKTNMSKSALVRFLISKNVANFLQNLPREVLDEYIRISKTPWINSPWNDDEDDF